jgi:hypothetical protein
MEFRIPDFLVGSVSAAATALNISLPDISATFVLVANSTTLVGKIGVVAAPRSAGGISRQALTTNMRLRRCQRRATSQRL